MSCALSHTPPNLLVARSAAQRRYGIHGLNGSGYNLLHVASSWDDAEGVGLALARGLSPVHRAATGWTALDLAAENGAVGAMEVLLRVREVREDVGRTRRAAGELLALEHAALHANVSGERGLAAVEMLLDGFGVQAFGAGRNRHQAYHVAFAFVVVWLSKCAGPGVVAVLKKVKEVGLLLKYEDEPCAFPGDEYANGLLYVHDELVADGTISRETGAFMNSWIAEYQSEYESFGGSQSGV